LASAARPLKVKLELRAITTSQRIRDNAVVMSSTMPSAKYSRSASPLRLAKAPEQRRIRLCRCSHCAGEYVERVTAAAHLNGYLAFPDPGGVFTAGAVPGSPTVDGMALTDKPNRSQRPATG